jgi:hypothetical protein
MAASCSMVHAASHGSTYEGVGVGGSPAAALASCCNNGGAVLEEGTAQGRDWPLVCLPALQPALIPARTRSES